MMTRAVREEKVMTRAVREERRAVIEEIMTIRALREREKASHGVRIGTKLNEACNCAKPALCLTLCLIVGCLTLCLIVGCLTIARPPMRTL